ncbi:MAG: hypothetical protein ACRD2X_16135 [Vicinamibacteraceae bacterium]
MSQLSDHLQNEAEVVVEDTAQSAAAQIRSEYSAAGYDTLPRAVTVQRTRQLGRRVRVDAPHAHLTEYGTAPRKTSKGYNRGTMPPNPVIGRVASSERRKMIDRLVEIVRRGVPGFAPDRVDKS